MKALPNRGDLFDKNTVRGSQFQQPLMEFSGACEVCNYLYQHYDNQHQYVAARSNSRP